MSLTLLHLAPVAAGLAGFAVVYALRRSARPSIEPLQTERPRPPAPRILPLEDDRIQFNAWDIAGLVVLAIAGAVWLWCRP